MTSTARWSHFRIGLVGLAAVALIGALVTVGSTMSPGTSTYTAELEHTGGLRIGEEVQVAGVGVGEVTRIELGDRLVRVTFTADDDVDLGSQTIAEVKVATLLGTHFLLVSPRGGGELADDTIPLRQTRVPFNLQDVLDEGVPEVNNLDAAGIERSLGTLADTLDASGGELGPALDGVRDLSALVDTRSDELGRLLSAARNVSAQLNDSGADMITLMRQADVILDALRTRRETIHALLRDLAALGTQLTGVIEDTRADLSPTLRDLDKVVAMLERHDGSLDAAIRTLAPTARYFANAGGNGSWLDQYAADSTPDNVNCAEQGGC
jgi:phospholipid/cholesterol/gamma-HCH transport system substrate-binding protein